MPSKVLLSEAFSPHLSSVSRILKPPTENAPAAPMLLEPKVVFAELVPFDGSAPPNENPPSPIMLPCGAEGFIGEPSEDLSSALGFGASHAAHAVADSLFVTMHTPHFHEPSTDDLNMEPQPSVMLRTALADSRSTIPSTSSLPFKLSSSLSPSPNSQSTYQSTNAFLVITLSPDDSSKELIFLIVCRCSSSQYVVPMDSKSSPKSDASILADPSPKESKASSALAFSSAMSLP
mmetsp:Transcript_46521/g.98708  ORF Transcript_46521/g.98708 Transcript_46521/m.98708 type:complete len:234 (-) Transcript_46521:81-782(-)